jgi:Ca2+-binding RTX toxin-like protein
MANVSDIVKQFYKNFYGVDPDSATLTSYTTKIESGQMNFNGLILEFYNSNNFKSDFEQVFRLHKAALLREPVLSDLKNALNEMFKPDFNIYNLADMYMQSQEFKNIYGYNLNNEQFIEKLYINVLGRPSDASGKSYWVNALNTGEKTLSQALVAFSESNENIFQDEDTLNAYWTTAFISNSDPNNSSNAQIKQQYSDMKTLFDLDDSGSGKYTKDQLINTAIEDNLERFNADNPGSKILQQYFTDTLEDSVSAGLQGILDSTASSKDTYSPSIVSLNPPDDSANVVSNKNFFITFDTDIQAGTGKIYLKKGSDNSIVQAIDINSTNPNEVYIKGNYIIFSFTQALMSETSYYINIDSTAIQDKTGHYFNGINDNTTFNFNSSSGQGGNGETFTGTTGNDTIEGTEGGDIINADAGNDNVYGMGGDDRIDAGGGSDNIYGGAGDDLINGEGGNDYIDGGAGNDNITDASGINTVLGGLGDDYIQATGAGGGNIDGGDGNDVIIGSASTDTIHGGKGDDIITPGTGSINFVYGDDGNDLIYGGASDFVHGGASNDTIYGSIGNDNIFGDDGNDVIYVSTGQDTLDGGNGTDVIIGTNAAESIILTSFNTTNFEIVYGQEGNDTIVGGAEDNIISGGVGVDNMDGGSGNNIFVFLSGDTGIGLPDAADGSKPDTIINFRSGYDKIQLGIAGTTTNYVEYDGVLNGTFDNAYTNALDNLDGTVLFYYIASSIDVDDEVFGWLFFDLNLNGAPDGIIQFIGHRDSVFFDHTDII